MSSDVRITRWVATIAGLLGFVLSVATPLLPVVQTTATLNWPQSGQLNNVTAPLITQTPVTMTVKVPCDVIRSMPPSGGMVLGTAPKNGKQAALQSLFVNVSTQRVDITDRNVVIASALRAACLPRFGAVLSTVPPLGGIERITSHGTVTVIDTGTCEISGAVTSLS